MVVSFVFEGFEVLIESVEPVFPLQPPQVDPSLCAG
jgi:hypothetical protein